MGRTSRKRGSGNLRAICSGVCFASKLMKLLASILLAATLCGCALVPCNHTFPVARWYWSKEAKDCRAEQKQDAQKP